MCELLNTTSLTVYLIINC